MNNKIAVAMSIYKADTVEFVTQAIESILNQSYENFDLFIEVDGPVREGLNSLLVDYSKVDNVFVNFNNDNNGLATRLNDVVVKSLLAGKYSFLARMDADDICLPERFFKQVDFLINNPTVAVVGSDVLEISESGDELFHKKMDASHDIIKRKIIKRCPFNHPSVMFRMSVFEDGFRYKSELMNTQDYYLWVDLLAAGKMFANINEPLLMFRINESFHSRRGFKKAMNDLNSRIYAFKKLDVFNLSNIIHTISLFLLRIAPASIKKWAYKTLR
ncbi:glycosyltransferase [Vibrio sp. YYF0003]|uniref:glycosyltransferase n=1 Tax=Vibrio sp. YYF0003 TaxID=3116646 RepID=UPI002EA25ABA|nr:glycosyltransferase [Vibrio sp. YYF0003]